VLKYYWKYHLQPTTDDNNTVAEPSSIEES
jgi:hypothetical protein